MRLSKSAAILQEQDQHIFFSFFFVSFFFFLFLFFLIPLGIGNQEGEGRVSVYCQRGSHHSSNGDQLGRAGRRRQSFRCKVREGATTDNSRSRGRRQRRSTPVHRCEIEKISCNLTGTRSTFFFSFFFFLFLFFFNPIGYWKSRERRQSLGVPPGREPPQLKRRPTGQGREEEEAESRCTAREGATTDNSRSRGRRQRRSTPVHRCEIEQISCNLTGSTTSTFFYFFFLFFFFVFFCFFFFFNPIGYWKSRGRRQSHGVPPGREPPQLKRRPTGQGREEEAESWCTAREGATTAQTETNWVGQGGGGRVSVYRQGGSHHSSNGDQLGRAGRRRQSLGVQPGREQPQTTHAAGGGGKGGVHQSIGVRLRKSAAI